MSKKISDTEAIRIYGPYIHGKSGRLAWYVLPPKAKQKEIFHSKIDMLQYIDKITTNIKTRVK